LLPSDICLVYNDNLSLEWIANKGSLVVGFRVTEIISLYSSLTAFFSSPLSRIGSFSFSNYSGEVKFSESRATVYRQLPAKKGQDPSPSSPSGT